MILLFWFGCAPADDAPAAAADTAALEARTGWWDVTIDDTWGGECVFEDPSTAWGDTERWWVEAHANGTMILRDAHTGGYACTMDGAAFSCVLDWLGEASDPTLAADETSEHHFEGALSDAETFTAQYVFRADCVGSGCRRLGDLYGPDFDYPCTATAGASGVWRE